MVGQNRLNTAGFLLFFILSHFVFFLVTPSPTTAQEPEKIIIAWEPWEPYQFKDKSGRLTGLDVEIIEAIMANMNAPFKWQETPWRRVLKDLEDGYLDAGLGASKTPERAVWGRFSDVYRTEASVLFVKKGTSGKFPFKTLQDIIGSDFKLGVTRGYYYGDAYEELIKNPSFQEHIEEVVVNENNYKKLERGRIDGFLSDLFSGTAGLKSLDIFDLVEIHPMTVYTDDIYILFSKKRITPDYVSKFNKSLQEIKANGTYASIMDKYLK